ncbi:transketolase family protein [Candidatus Azambacteria bacterium]|nr:transketolase family protein [Candidatus Azambacteria bacterium]
MPINSNAKLNPNLFDQTKVEQKPSRFGFGQGLVLAGEADKQVVALCADLTESTQILPFKNKFPERFIQVGVAEQNLAGLASGLAASGKIPFIASYGMFSPGRNWEQIRTTIAYNEVNVKIAIMHAGISVGPDGGTHQAIEDLAITRVIPKVVIINPCDYIEAREATLAAAKHPLATFLRFHREPTPVITTDESNFEIGQAEVLFTPKDNRKVDVVIFACGPLVYRALLVAQELEKQGLNIYVVNNHTIKPMDEKTIIELAKIAGAVVTVEEHQIAGGMGSAVAEILARNYPVPIEFIGVHDKFGQSGLQDQLLDYYGMGVADIKEAVKKVIKRKLKI